MAFDWRAALLPGFQALSTFFVALMTLSVDKSVKQNEQQVARFAAERKAWLDSADFVVRIRVNEDSMRLRIYNEVMQSVKHKDAGEQKVARVLVISMISDSVMRSGLLDVLREAGAPENRKELEKIVERENAFRVEQSEVVLAGPAGPEVKDPADAWRTMRVDVFWCEGDPSSEQDADRLAKRLAASGARGRIRTRLLPSSVNAQPGYRWAGYGVRQNNGEERLAERIRVIGDSVIGQRSGAVARQFSVSYVRQSTPGYLSAFLCPGS